MARKLKADSSNDFATSPEEVLAVLSDAPAPVRWGRKPKAAIPASEPASAGEGETAETDAFPALPVTDSAPAKGRPGRKAKGWEAAAALSLLQEAMEQQPEPILDQPDATVEPATARHDALVAGTANPVSAGENGDVPAHDAAPSPIQDVASAGKSAAQWARATDTVRFDWTEIERTASQDGPNQVMAKLLVAARAEGTNSRWPL